MIRRRVELGQDVKASIDKKKDDKENSRNIDMKKCGKERVKMKGRDG